MTEFRAVRASVSRIVAVAVPGRRHGVAACVEIPDDPTLELAGDFTIEAWVKLDDASGVRNVVAKWASPEAGKLSYRLYLEDGIPKIGLSSDGTVVYPLAGTEAVSLDEWVHLAMVRSGDSVRLLVDNAEVATGTFAGALHDGDSYLLIGAYNVTGEHGYFNGMIDEVRISSVDEATGLGQLEVNYRYNARNQLVHEYAGPTLTAPALPTDASVKTYLYDNNGNVTDIVETVGAVEVSNEHMLYDELNRMLTHTGPKGTETFTYRGAEWHRASANGKSFLYDGDNVLADISGGTTSAFYVTPFLDQNLSITNAAGTYYYSQDGLGSVRTLTDSFGTVKNSYDYLPFGGAHSPGTSVTVEQRYTYTGREKNPSSSLMYYRYRQYDPRVGRFGGRDPLGYEDTSTHERNGITINVDVNSLSAGRSTLLESLVDAGFVWPRILDVVLYAYVGSSPSMRVDSFGLAPGGDCQYICTMIHDGYIDNTWECVRKRYNCADDYYCYKSYTKYTQSLYPNPHTQCKDCHCSPGMTEKDANT